MPALIEQFYDQLAQNAVPQVLQQLRQVLALANSELLNDVILLSAQHQKLQSDVRRGVIDYAQENLAHNQLLNNLLGLVNALKDDPTALAGFERVDKTLRLSIQERDLGRLSEPARSNLWTRMATVKERGLRWSGLWIHDAGSPHTHEMELLASLGLAVQEAASSEEAHSILMDPAGLPCDLLISDIKRGGRPDEGLHFHQQLLAEGMDLPVIFYVGQADRSRGVPPFAFGITHQPQELLHLAMDVLERLGSRSS